MAELAGNVGRQFDPGVAAAIIPIVAAEADAGSQPARDAHPAPPAHAYPAPVAEPATR
jgi:hypothetical protein